MSNKPVENNSNENEKKINVELTEEQLATLKNIEEEKAKLEKEKAEVAERVKEVSEKELAIESKKTAKSLKESQKMVSITIPVSELNPHDLVVPVCINGYSWLIKRGEEVEVPEEVKRILKEAKYI